MLLTQVHNCHGPSHKYYPLYPTCYLIWVLTKNTHHIATKIGPQNYIFPTQSPTLSGLWAKPKESPKFQKSHDNVFNSKSHYDVANSKARYTMRHYLQSLLLHSNTLQNLKIISTKPKFLFGIYFHKAQIPIWHLFSQGPNSNLALLYKAQNIILATIFTLFHKTPILIWQLS